MSTELNRFLVRFLSEFNELRRVVEIFFNDKLTDVYVCVGLHMVNSQVKKTLQYIYHCAGRPIKCP